MGLRAAVQALKKAEPLKDKVQRCKDLLNDNDAWQCQQQLQQIYQRVLILDLEYALDRKVEQELWNLGFKNYIAMLQAQAKDRKNPKRGEFQAMLSWCLEAASGFYLALLQEICTAFDLDLPFRRKGYVYGCISPWKAVEKLSAPHKSSCFYACQYCLVHLGDIARYRNQNKQAELFYRHAVSLSPSSGQPYNQLALLEASRGDKLSTVFHYSRSIAVKHPFPVAIANLEKTLASVLNDETFIAEGRTKLTSQGYIVVFLKLHAILHNLGDESVASCYEKLLTETLTALVATESFTSVRLVQMLTINLYAEGKLSSEAARENFDGKSGRCLVLDLIAGSLSALLLPVYTIKQAVVDYYALPSIKLCLDWIALQPSVLEESAFASRLQIWPSFCLLLNGLRNCIGDFEFERYAKTPLPEDRDLQGFLPLEKSLEALQFNNTDLEEDSVALNKLRGARILTLGRKIAQCKVNGSSLIRIHNEKEAPEKHLFSAFVTEGVEPSTELMKELEELSLNKEPQPSLLPNSPVPSESASSKGSSEFDVPEFLLEKRAGILKPQGLIDRNKEHLILSPEDCKPERNSTRKPRQNVAMQAIMRRVETEQKQVTFKNGSPVLPKEEKVVPTVKTNESKLQNQNTSSIPNYNEARQENVNDPDLRYQNSQYPIRVFQNQNPPEPAKLSMKNQPSPNIGSQKNLPIPNHEMTRNDFVGARDSGNFAKFHQFGAVSSDRYEQTSFGQQILSPKMPYPNDFMGQFDVFPSNQVNESQSLENSYAYDNLKSKEFDPWKEQPQLPQPPVSWWDSAICGQRNGKNVAGKESFSNWPNTGIALRPEVDHPGNFQHGLQSFGSRINDSSLFNIEDTQLPPSGNTYSLFSGNTWSLGCEPSNIIRNASEMKIAPSNQQSLWSGPGPSPLERLLEQQKSLREGGT